MKIMILVLEALGIFWLVMSLDYLFKAQGVKEANRFVVDNYKPNNVYKKFLEITNYWYNAYIKKGKYCICYAVVIFIVLIIAILCSK